MTIQLHIPETTDEGIKEAALAKGTVSQLSNIIILKHVEKVFCGVLRLQQQQFTEIGEIPAETVNTVHEIRCRYCKPTFSRKREIFTRFTRTSLARIFLSAN
jgi:hypothetical protein